MQRKWEYLARNLNADVLVSQRKPAPSCNIFDQNGMDFVTEISFCNTPVVD